jgi:hypothetical protein
MLDLHDHRSFLGVLLSRSCKGEDILKRVPTCAYQEGIDLAAKCFRSSRVETISTGFSLRMKPLNPQNTPISSEHRMTLETIISIGVLGWLAIGVVLMGLGIW